ncbi:TIGR02611 family protein [Streptomyces sp. NBC_00053]|uniref:TIGR02611 family protein n=1 Tax=unclassified Streptomyces TaxID=2593676 RepID=UPI000F5BB86A|nr:MULTISPECIES: TIGR02611 family protein [unclassified Streptomyces]WSG49725.1 TIGR02611 family protein [Streptomyces sp. NBC_01732]WSX00378.1 TIGR02611 family protein [Streptomyces sp. NBC_00987]MCX4397826.1 TIGR02611 family protein [Streptomyces sp. NBC_01767]MCX5099475.1 TIGR02611 family protein [Streptomyces sp. NBC_00439]MCX5159021.1 TIGR02611 family protein [Streptomyces sp. NBC_00305]
MNAERDVRNGDAASATPVSGTGDRAGVTGEVTEGVTKERELGSRAPGFIKASRTLHLSWQVGVFIVGLAVVVAGIIMLPLPGPGWLVIFGGMAIWATEFVWAQLVLRWTRRKVTEAAQRALDPKVRRRNIILTSVGLVIIAVLVGIYVWKFGITMPWKIHE